MNATHTIADIKADIAAAQADLDHAINTGAANTQELIDTLEDLCADLAAAKGV
jgi:hypothetical protein